MGAVLPWPAAVPVWLTQSKKLRYVTDYNRAALWQRRVVQSVVGREERDGARDDLQAHRIWLTGSPGGAWRRFLLAWWTAARGLDFDDISHLNAAICRLQLNCKCLFIVNKVSWCKVIVGQIIEPFSKEMDLVPVCFYRLILLLMIKYYI